MENESHMQRIITPMPAALVAAIDDYRFKNRLASRSEAVRQLITLALQPAPSQQRRTRERKQGT